MAGLQRKTSQLLNLFHLLLEACVWGGHTAAPLCCVTLTELNWISLDIKLKNPHVKLRGCPACHTKLEMKITLKSHSISKSISSLSTKTEPWSFSIFKCSVANAGNINYTDNTNYTDTQNTFAHFTENTLKPFLKTQARACLRPDPQQCAAEVEMVNAEMIR